ncbi:sulfotransferase domain-containing protein [Pseudophaeobacter sp.]|uniref:sulfotransferase domain-containing protein n=1 Tax=Pseudophaeobacter sp. TaxID=1971739 RepID=UPI00329718EA
MTQTSPLRYYSGIATDGHNWDAFEYRPGDVFVCVPPKSGTTWMQTICGLLIFGDPEAEIAIPDLSPWIEIRLNPEDFKMRLARLAQQSHQRFLKSHSPLDGVPYFEDCTYLICHRHPLDVHFSMRNHVHNMKIDALDHFYTDDIAACFDAFLNNSIEDGGMDQPSLELIAHHLTTARAMAHLPNVHLFHYATLSQDLPGQMARVAKAIGVSHAPDLFDRLVAKASFKAMKSEALMRAPGATRGLYKDPSAFFNSGQSGQWQGWLNAGQIADYNAKIATLLSPEDRHYLETGTAPSFAL